MPERRARIAERLRRLGESVGYRTVEVEVAHVEWSDDDRLGEELLRSGMPDWMADGVVSLGQLRAGVNAQATAVVRVLTGRDPRSLADFLRDHAAIFARAEPAQP